MFPWGELNLEDAGGLFVPVAVRDVHPLRGTDVGRCEGPMLGAAPDRRSCRSLRPPSPYSRSSRSTRFDPFYRWLLTAASDDHEGVTFGDDVKSPRVHVRA